MGLRKEGGDSDRERGRNGGTPGKIPKNGAIRIWLSTDNFGTN
jgi:hypothetical protein